MKARFTNIDIVAAVRELQSLVGLRVTNVYDVDHKSYLFKFAKPDAKVVLLIESGIRLHTTDYEWPKNPSPSGFSMKLRKHVRNRRLESIRQLGVDRIVDMQFGIREAAYHVILELYDRGNIILTDHDYMVLNILRPRTDQDADVRYAVHEKYPLFMAKEIEALPEEKVVRDWFSVIKGKEALKKVVGSHLFFGSALVEHALLSVGLTGNQKVSKDSDLEAILPKVMQALQLAEAVYKETAVNVSKGYITYKVSDKAALQNQENQCQVYEEFHSFPFIQLKDALVLEKSSFMNAVDEFYSLIESQRVDVGILEQQKQALKKLENVKQDHERRLDALRRTQEKEQLQARLIEENVDLVDRIIVYMRTLMAAELSWRDVAELLERRRERGDEVAEHVIKADIATNMVTILLENKREVDSEEEEEEDAADEEAIQDDIIKVDINLNQSAFQNVTRLHTVKKQAAAKEHKTVEASEMALKNAERKTKQALKDVATIGTITKARKTQWFEKFFWFISTEGYLVIGGREAQQNDMLVKRYMKAQDFYVHADLHGASSVIVKNPTGGPPPPKTLNEAGVMAMSYSAAWEAKMPAKAWWVFANQVTKTAPTGEYLGTGSFMIRGKKNFLPPTAMVMGFGFLFKLDEESAKNRDRQRDLNEETESGTTDGAGDEDVVLEVDDSDDEPGAEKATTDAADEPEAELNEGQSFLRSLVSKLVSGGEEESTLITSTTSGFVPKTPQQQKQAAAGKKGGDASKASGPPTKNADKKGSVPQVKKPSVESDDDDWSDHKKKRGGKGSRPVKNYNQKHQGLPAKPAKRTKDKPEPVTAAGLEQDGAVAEGDSAVFDTGSSLLMEQTGGNVDEKTSEAKSWKEGQVVDKDEDDGDDDDAEAPLTEDAQILKSLVGNPLPSDVILFCIPLCAPYVAMHDCRVKVKLLPGTAKRGKAAKTCFQAFLKDKTLSVQERDVLKSVKDQDMSRNFPGSVKLAIQQQKFKARRR